MAAAKQLFRPARGRAYTHLFCPSPTLSSTDVLVFPKEQSLKSYGISGPLVSVGVVAAKASSGNVAGDGGEDGVSLGTMKLPANTDLARFEILLFQWANSLSQGASLPLPTPLKVDRVKGGARLGFTTVGDENTDVNVYIDCLVFPATDSSGPVFRAIRNGVLKDKSPPGEPRVMRSLLQALQKSVEIARI